MGRRQTRRLAQRLDHARYAIAGFLPDADLGVVRISNGGIGAGAALDRAFAELAKKWLSRVR